ncbi:hypothetical protein SYNPS1DRAFT_31078, partial [Syncephalis pseudoplumigaleata]
MAHVVGGDGDAGQQRMPQSRQQERGGTGRGRGGGRGGRGGRGARGRVELSSTATGFLAMGPSALAASRSSRISAGMGGGGGGGGGGMPGTAGAAMIDLDTAISDGTAKFSADLWAPVAYDAVGRTASTSQGSRQGRRKAVMKAASTVAVKMEEDEEDDAFAGVKVKQEEDVLSMLQQEVSESAAGMDVGNGEEGEDAGEEDGTHIPPPARHLLEPVLRDNTHVFPRT